ncbi:MAG TPA: membrane-bound lytic murein transglycosylase MltF [Gammaproteobacteria bacterium]
MRVLAAITLALLLSTCENEPSLLEQIQQRGELRVVTRNSPSTFYLGADGYAGFEYDLASLFAAKLGVELEMFAADSFSQILPTLGSGAADFAAAGLSITPVRKEDFWFGPPYMEITPQVVYRYGEERPREPADLAGHVIKVVAGSSHAETLQALAEKYEKLEFVAQQEIEAEELLYRVSQREIDYTVADSTDVALNQRYYPEIRVAFDLGEPEPLAWAFRRSDDDSLYRAAVAFLEELRRSGGLEQIVERHYGHTDKFDYVGTRIFMRHIDTRLPAYRETFKEAAELTGAEWQLLAAMGYQESHWDPEAVSPTGVRGIMMLTRATARYIGVENRLDPEKSILGGARYFQMVKDQVPERIPEPDRTWMALAAYNVGFGHLEDARIITERQGGNPDRWIDVRERLPLLTQKKWYKQTKYGYARGHEPVIYVENIRSYYDILVWMTTQDEPETTSTL